MADVPDLIASEAREAASRYGDFASAHEALGVLAEEVQELADAVRSHSLGGAAREAIQVAAVAARLAEHCLRPSPEFAERSRLWPS